MEFNEFVERSRGSFSIYCRPSTLVEEVGLYVWYMFGVLKCPVNVGKLSVGV